MTELCRPLTTPIAFPQGGQPRNAVGDIVYTLVLRAYCNLPGRRFPRLLSLILEHVTTKGAIIKVPGASSAQSCLGEGWMESLLTELIVTTSVSFRSLETIMAVDCSGFRGSRGQNFNKRKTGGKGRERGWKRTHIIGGVRTGIITAAIVTNAPDHESPRLTPLLEMTCPRFKVKEVLGDSAYASARNFSKAIYYNSVGACFEWPGLTPELKKLIGVPALPLRGVEPDFAVDSTGFSTSRFVRWFDEKYGVERSGHDWVKVHVMAGVKTNIVTAIEIRGRSPGDAPRSGPLVRTIRCSGRARSPSRQGEQEIFLCRGAWMLPRHL